MILTKYTLIIIIIISPFGIKSVLCKSLLMFGLPVVIVNGIFSFFQEYKAERILSSLSDMIPK
ncbi:MAG: hypothetical protein Q8754_02935, partial [Sweet potato little leaf phytoplasma]|nr:hypothetical protein [Sweet potato little leaf phytoplasma]